MFKFLASLMLVLSFVSMASAQTDRRLTLSTEVQQISVRETYALNRNAAFSGQQYDSIRELETLDARIGKKVHASGTIGLAGFFDTTKIIDPYTHKATSQTRQPTMGKASGRLAEFDIRATAEVYKNLTVIGGYTDFGIHYSSSSTQTGIEYSSTQRTSFHGILMGLADRYDYKRLRIRGEASWLPHLTRGIHYTYKNLNNDSITDIDTLASGYNLSGSVGVLVVDNGPKFASIRAELVGRFRDVETPFGNQLFRITSDEIPLTTRWRSLGGNIVIGF